MPAYCGKCNKEIPLVNGVAVDIGHDCWKMLKGGRQIVVSYDDSGYTVTEGEHYADQLGFDEMLGQVVNLMHPEIGKPRYQMLTFAQWKKRHPYMYGETKKEATEPPVVEHWQPIDPPAVPEKDILTDDDIPF